MSRKSEEKFIILYKDLKGHPIEVFTSYKECADWFGMTYKIFWTNLWKSKKVRHSKVYARFKGVDGAWYYLADIGNIMGNYSESDFGDLDNEERTIDL